MLAASVSFDHAAGEHRQVRRVKRTGISDVRSAEVSVGSKGLPDNEGMISVLFCIGACSEASGTLAVVVTGGDYIPKRGVL